VNCYSDPNYAQLRFRSVCNLALLFDQGHCGGGIYDADPLIVLKCQQIGVTGDDQISLRSEGTGEDVVIIRI